MAFGGYLIKIKGTTDYVVPEEYMQATTYKGTYSVLDKDSKRNGNGELIRTVLPHKVAHCSVDTLRLTNTQIGALMSAIQSRYTDSAEKKVRASIWVTEINDYIEADYYIPDIDFTINHIEDNEIKYEPFTLELIGY